jgi:hypothetical protein
MRRHSPKKLLSAAMIIIVAACSRDLVSPGVAPLPPGAIRPDVIVDFIADDSLSADFTVTPTGGLFKLGKHAIFFPENSICNPAASSYGPQQWDEACEPLTENVQIHAEVRKAEGRTWIDFTPALRFVPTSDPNGYVWLYMKSDAAFDPENLPALSILFSHQMGDPGINEALEDPTQKTYVWAEGGVTFRRIKHFSIYNQTSDAIGSTFEFVGGLVQEIEF